MLTIGLVGVTVVLSAAALDWVSKVVGSVLMGKISGAIGFVGFLLFGMFAVSEVLKG